ncbi:MULTISPECIES: GTP cyclohydrolase I FolE [unclassified Candidatus Lariskella]|uniref:GTP cyclohydrolase I FolE n=1 Tax=unclassified Candidatus Lariskella TaxID=2632605 RepID=UPI0030D5EB27
MNSKRNGILRGEAEEAIRTLLRWIGDNPEREGLFDTPARVVRSFDEYFVGYKIDPKKLLETTFSEVDGYSDLVLLKDITIESHCEHHMAPIVGVAHVAYIPNGRVVGISKLARVVCTFSKRLQLQERLTWQIANCINEALMPKGVAVVIEAKHNCITSRGVYHPATIMHTQAMIGAFEAVEMQKQFLSRISI